MAVGALESGGERVLGRLLADIDPDTGAVIVDPETGHPRLSLHYSATEVGPWLGVSPAEVRRRCRSGEWPCRLVGHRALVYMSAADLAVAIDTMRHRPRGVWDEEWAADHPGIRGVVMDPDEDEEGDR